MKALFLADQHYRIGNKLSDRRIELLRQFAAESDPASYDGVFLAGDNAYLEQGFSHHRALFRILQELFPTTIGFVAGNHDLRGRPLGKTGWQMLDEEYPRLAEQEGVVYLEHQNAEIEGWTIAGTYGHHDNSLARPASLVTARVMEEGQFADPDLIWDGYSDHEICEELLARLEDRIQGASKIITVSHAVPSYAMIGCPLSDRIDLFAFYAGTSKFRHLFERHPVRYHICGHSHAVAREQLNGTDAINVGSTATREFRTVSIDTTANEVTRAEFQIQ